MKPFLNCARCQLFVPASGMDYYLPDYRHDLKGEGFCTLNPEWVRISDCKQHFCSRFVSDWVVPKTATEENVTRWRLDDRGLYQRGQQERALVAEKKLKAARKELRELKAAQANPTV